MKTKVLSQLLIRRRPLVYQYLPRVHSVNIGKWSFRQGSSKLLQIEFHFHTLFRLNSFNVRSVSYLVPKSPWNPLTNQIPHSRSQCRLRTPSVAPSPRLRLSPVGPKEDSFISLSYSLCFSSPCRCSLLRLRSSSAARQCSPSSGN